MKGEEIHCEEQFWTTTLLAALGQYPVERAVSSANAALELFRILWVDQHPALEVTLLAMDAGCEVHWSLGAAAIRARGPGRKVSARCVWSAAFGRAWSEGMAMVCAAEQADRALRAYANKIGLDPDELLGKFSPENRRQWRESWVTAHK